MPDEKPGRELPEALSFKVHSADVRHLTFTEDAVVFMDLIKTLSWKNVYELVCESVLKEGRNLVTRDDIDQVVSLALARMISDLYETEEIVDSTLKSEAEVP